MARMRALMIALVVAPAVLVASPSANAMAQDSSFHLVSGRPYTFTPACQSRGVDGEVSLAIDHRTGRMVAAWMQDIQALGDPGGLPLATTIVVTASSSDGGSTWTPGAPPSGGMICAQPPGPADVVFDPSVSVGPDGRWYLSRLDDVLTLGPVAIGTTTVDVATSTNGTTWSLPVPIAVPQGSFDFDAVFADPAMPGRAYVTWASFPIPPPNVMPNQQDQLMISTTTDGGRTFSMPATLHKAPPGFFDDISRMVALADGTLLDAYFEIPVDLFQTGRGPFGLYAIRSKDGGATWSAPVLVGSGSIGNLVDPEHPATVLYSLCCLFSLAAGPGDTAEVAWTTNSSLVSADVHVASTADGGKTWSAAADLHRSAQTFEATVAVDTAGTVAVTWYDFTADHGGPSLLTTVWVALSHDGGASWSVTRLAGPFDDRTAGASLGDFQSLVAVEQGFEAVFTLAKPLAQVGPTDIFAAAVPSSMSSAPGQGGAGSQQRGAVSSVAASHLTLPDTAAGTPSASPSLPPGGAGAAAGAMAGLAALLAVRRRRDSRVLPTVRRWPRPYGG